MTDPQIDQSRMDQCRMPPLEGTDLSDLHQAALEDFRALRKTEPSGPWDVFIRSPELFTHTQRMGEFLRFRSRLSGRLGELAILLVARNYGQDFEFAAHAQEAEAAGVAASVVEAIRDGRRPDGLDGDAQLVVDFVTELLHRRSVSDATFARAHARFGEPGCVELAGIVGYYGLLALVMNMARVPPPPGRFKLPRFPE
jgi:4-carboxymuconolactone decarboxylase